MSQFQVGYVGTGFGGFGFQVSPDIVEGPPPGVNGKPRPELGAETEYQPRMGIGMGNGPLGILDPRLSLPGNLLHVNPWIHWPGTYATYRVMRGHPTIALARAMLFASILAGQAGVEADKDAPAAWSDLITDEILPLRAKYLSDSCFSIDYGNQPFEIIWGLKNGYLVPVRFKPLLPDLTQAILDKGGTQIGIHNTNVDLYRFKYLMVTNDAEADNPYGRSRLENIRKDWARSELLDDEAMRAAKKIAGVLAIIRHPPGGYRDVNGKLISYQANAAIALRALTTGMGITLETIGFDTADLRNNPDLAKLSMTDVDFYDAGSIAASLTGFTDRQQYYDGRMFRGMLKPERSGLEAKGGTKADAEAHGDVGMVDNEQVNMHLHDALNKGPVDDTLELNFGPKARGKVRIKPSPLRDINAAGDNLILQGIQKYPALFEMFLSQVDVDAIATRRNIPKSEDVIKMDGLSAEMQSPTNPGNKPADPNAQAA